MHQAPFKIEKAQQTPGILGHGILATESAVVAREAVRVSLFAFLRSGALLGKRDCGYGFAARSAAVSGTGFITHNLLQILQNMAHRPKLRKNFFLALQRDGTQMKNLHLPTT
jgi:hypothetical protein